MSRYRPTYRKPRKAADPSKPKRAPAKKKAPQDMTPKQLAREMSKGIDERKHIQAPCVRMGREMKWKVVEFGIKALERYDKDGIRTKNPIMNTKGTPDSYWCKDGVHFWVEFKKPVTGKLSDDQVTMIRELRAEGETVYVIDDIGVLNGILRGYHKPRHEQITGLKQEVVG